MKDFSTFRSCAGQELRLGRIALAPAFVCALVIGLSGCSKPADTSTAVGQSGTTAAPGTSTARPTVGTDIDVGLITAKVKSALLTDPDVKSIDFKVETRKGEVLLSGFATNQSQIDRALAVAKAVPGVKSVDNRVSMKGASTKVGSTVDDGIVTTQVKAALLADASVKSFDISVVTRKNEVQLSGFVDNQAQSDRAVEVARGIKGASSVINDMKVKK